MEDEVEEREPLLIGDSDTELYFPVTHAPHVNVTRKAHAKTGFNVLFFKRFYRIAKLMFPCLLSKTLLFFLFLIFIQIAEELNISNTGQITADFYLALDTKDKAMFKHALLLSFIVTFFTAVCKSASLLVSGILHVRWRGLITQAIHNRYFIDINYFEINSNKDIDNPDQRITQDVDRFTDQLTQALPDLVIAPIVIIYYAYQTTKKIFAFFILGVYIVSTAFIIIFVKLKFVKFSSHGNCVGIESPLLIFGFFLLSTIINKFAMSPIASLVFKQEAKEGDFRYHHVQVRNKVESLALYRGGAAVLAKGDISLQKLLRAMLNVVHWSLPLNVSVNIFDYVSTPIIFGILGMEIIYFHHYSSLNPAELAAAISKNTFFSIYLLHSFSRVTDLAVNFSDIAGYTHRIGELLEALDVVECKRGAKTKYDGITGSSSNCHNDKQALILTNLSLAPPGWNFPLVQDLNFIWSKGECVLLDGPVGSGKSSLIRVISGLWEPFAGYSDLLVDIGNSGVMFVPQEPYLISGTLAEQITFPEQVGKENLIEDDFDTVNSVYTGTHKEERLTEAINMAALVQIKDRVGGMQSAVEYNWYKMLSPGEMQQVAFARLFYHRPPFAVLDEASSFLSEELELKFYGTLRNLGITFFSVGHRSSLHKFHEHFLSFNELGEWTYK